ncbi:MAG: MATE family efflux transporter [Spirochaetales bacterium]|nr:MATE family efflux transporter [Spirochaetales bacterium]
MNNNNREFLATEPVGKLIWKLSIPTVCAQIINMLYNIVDRVYIGHIPETGALALTGLGVCFPLLLVVSAFASLVCAGGAPRASIFLGKKDYEMAEKTLANSFVLLIIISLSLSVILSIWHRPLLLAFGASENTIEYASAYMKIYSLGTIFVQLTLGMNAFITAQGFTKISMMSVLIGAISNIILDPIFIFGLGMGVQGAALATVLSQGISMIWVLSFFFRGKGQLRLRRKYMKLESKVILPAIALGTATFIMQSTESIISICFNSSLLKYGGDIAVGAMTILASVMQLIMMPTQGFGQGTSPVISFNYGAGNSSRVKEAFRTLLKINLSFTIIAWSFMMLFPKVIVSMFATDAALVEFTSRAIRVYLATICLFGIQMSCQNTFTAIGSAFSSILVAVMRKIVLLIPLIYILPAIFTGDKTTAVYLAEPIADFLSVCFCSALFYKQFKKAMDKICQ